MIETEGELSGRRLAPTDALPFRCHAGLACFNSCCRDKRLTLLPYDVVRLRRALGRSSAELLAEHAELEIEASGWPTVRLKLSADGRCPFVREAGCGVYSDRPTCCRIYPLARAVRLDGGGEPAHFFLVAETGARCLGFGAPDAPTVEAWARGQGLDEYRAANDRLTRLLLHPDRPRPLSLSQAELHAAVLALYNVDVFRELVRRPGFAAEARLPAARVARAIACDEALLELSQDWLATRLFGRADARTPRHYKGP
ncbi:MAG TPA: YkgJ family cysteine cluster protein [Anaeromyxobacter sp.]